MPSIKNILFLSLTKKILWLGLFLGSVSIHLIFNSVVFETNFEGSSWQVSIATEGFVDGMEEYFVPGASLAHPGISVSFLNLTNTTGDDGYGVYTPLSDSWDAFSPVNQGIANATRTAATWENMTIQDCFSEYRFCRPMQKYRDVVVVVEGVGSGWMRSEVFNLGMESNYTQTWEIWDEHIPPNATNSLWFSAACFNTRYADGIRSISSCSTTYYCAAGLGDPLGKASADTTTLTGSTWTIPFQSQQLVPAEYDFNQTFNDLNVAYCLAEPNQGYEGKVGASNLLLLAVVICTFTKVFLAI